eukprot:SAG25_NODE_7626_length_470_cov_0.840970_1_plen_69_part_00
MYYLVGAASSACFQPPMRRGGRLRGDAPAAASVQSKMVGSPKVTAIGKRTQDTGLDIFPKGAGGRVQK